MICIVDGCDKPSRSAKKPGHCEMHYYRLRRTGTTEQQHPWTRRPTTCSVPDCGMPHHSMGYCGKHEARFRRHGTPTATPIPQSARALPRGSEHPGWTGDEPSYNTAHERVYRARGKASAHPCVDCGQPALHWSYSHEAVNPITDDRGYEYSADPADYAPRCVPCHKRHDLSRYGGAA